MRAKFPLWARNTKHARFPSHLHGSNITGRALHCPGGRGGPPENCRNPQQIFWHTDELRVTSFMPHVPKIFVIFNQPPAAVSCSSSWNERGNLSKYLSTKQKTRNKYFLSLLNNIFNCDDSDVIRYFMNYCQEKAKSAMGEMSVIILISAL